MDVSLFTWNSRRRNIDMLSRQIFRMLFKSVICGNFNIFCAYNIRNETNRFDKNLFFPLWHCTSTYRFDWVLEDEIEKWSFFCLSVLIGWGKRVLSNSGKRLVVDVRALSSSVWYMALRLLGLLWQQLLKLIHRLLGSLTLWVEVPEWAATMWRLSQ